MAAITMLPAYRATLDRAALEARYLGASDIASWLFTFVVDAREVNATLAAWDLLQTLKRRATEWDAATPYLRAARALLEQAVEWCDALEAIATVLEMRALEDEARQNDGVPHAYA